MRGKIRLATPAMAVAFGVVVLALAVLAIPIARALTHAGSLGPPLVLILPFSLVGVIVAYRQPSNALGWILLGAGFFFVVEGDASLYTVLDYRQHGGHLIFGPLAVIVQPSWAPAIVCMVLALLLFPDARLPLGRWRWMLWPFLGVAVLWVLGAFGIAAHAIVSHTVHITTSGDLASLDHPSGDAAWWGIVEDVFFPVILVCGLGSIAKQIISFRRSTGERRLQLKWLLAGGAVFISSGVLTVGWSNSTTTVLHVIGTLATLGLLALPVCIVIAILKYRLFEIDRIISRTLSYAIVTGLLVGVYVGLIALTTRALPLSSPIGVAASTLAAAALFSPLRRSVQRIVDRRFNRAHYDAVATVAAFSSGLRDEVDLASVQTDLIDVVRRSVQPSHVSVWLRERSPV
ncbi:MAG TPA: hypothetical protein VGL75_06780 [Acidothermaceae bacterium]|jgi:hypothetical protein